MKNHKFSWLLSIIVIGLIFSLAGCPEVPNIPDEPDDIEYTITIAGPFANGTITTTPTAATQGTQVYVTVTPDEGCRLRPGSLKGNNANITNQVNATTWRFTMPATNVTIRGEFEIVPSDWDWNLLLDEWTAELLPIVNSMTLEEKAGQMTQALMAEFTNAQVTSQFLGSIHAGGHNVPIAGNTPTAWYNWTNNLITASDATRLKIPIIYGHDVMHGQSKVLNATILPHNVGFGAIAAGDLARGKALAYDAGRLTAEEMLATGVRWGFGPVLSVSENQAWGRTYECYAERVDIVTAVGQSYINGLHKGGAASCLKHWGPVGLFSIGSGIGQFPISKEKYKEYTAPFEAAIESRAMSIMVSSESRNHVRIHQDTVLLTELLKEEMGYRGMLLSDYHGIHDIPGVNYTAKLATGINAGIDMVMTANDNWQATINGIIANVDSGAIPIERINDAVLRILLFKKSIGHQSDNPLHNFWDYPALTTGPGQIRTQVNINRAVEMVADSLVLLKNEDDIISRLNEYNNILLTGPGAANIGLQCGGWTIEWQGSSTNATLTAGVNILQGIRTKLGSTTRVRHSSNGDSISGFIPDLVIAVVAENSYAEYSGDVQTGTISPNAGSTTALNAAFTNNPNVPVVLLILSGRPIHLSTDNLSANPQAIVAAWLPGSEGGTGIAEVLFGDRDFVGKTPYSWYTTRALHDADWNEQLAAGWGGVRPDSRAVYPFGHGLRKGQTSGNL